jgi:hypothetical protein
VIVAVVAVRVVKVAVYEVVGVVAVGDRFVAAAGAMYVIRGVAAAGVSWCAGGRVRRGHAQSMLVHMIAVDVVQVAVVEVVGMAVVLNGRVAAGRAMLMGMLIVFLTGHNGPPRVVAEP